MSRIPSTQRRIDVRSLGVVRKLIELAADPAADQVDFLEVYGTAGLSSDRRMRADAIVLSLGTVAVIFKSRSRRQTLPGIAEITSIRVALLEHSQRAALINPAVIHTILNGIAGHQRNADLDNDDETAWSVLLLAGYLLTNEYARNRLWEKRLPIWFRVFRSTLRVQRESGGD